MPKFYLNKIVRGDIIDEYINDPQAKIKYRFLVGREAVSKLIEKIHEEAAEIPTDESDEEKVKSEFADLQEVMDALRERLGFSEEEIRETQEIKRQKKGGFDEAAYIETLDFDEGSEWVEYYRRDPIKYPENLELGPEGIYVHYKSEDSLYEVLYIGTHTETNERYVIYKPLYKHEGKPDVGIRPYDMFFGDVEVDGIKRPRFTFLGKEKS